MDKLFLAMMMLVLTEFFRLLRDRRIERLREERKRLEHRVVRGCEVRIEIGIVITMRTEAEPPFRDETIA